MFPKLTLPVPVLIESCLAVESLSIVAKLMLLFVVTKFASAPRVTAPVYVCVPVVLIPESNVTAPVT